MRVKLHDHGSVVNFFYSLFSYLLLVPILDPIVVQHTVVSAVVIPTSNCYAFDNMSHLLDFTEWNGHPFEYDGKDADLVVRFCKDVERRSQEGYIDFGHYMDSRSIFTASEHVAVFQKYYGGDLMNCESSYDKMGRTAQVNIICGNCLTGACKGEHGCICSVTYDETMCQVFVELSIPCVKHGPRVFNGFTVGFHPRTWEIVYDGMTQFGFEKVHREFSFQTEQTQVTLYFTAVSSHSSLVGKPNFKVNPESGLEVKISSSGVSSSSPTTLSPTVLNVEWRCEVAHIDPYEVNISIPVEGYQPVEFTLTKSCGYMQSIDGDSSRGWATFGVVCCIFIVLSTAVCCGGFFYRTRIEHQRGLYALPGMTILSAIAEAVSGQQGYVRDGSTNQTAWEQEHGVTRDSHKPNERRYGSI